MKPSVKTIAFYAFRRIVEAIAFLLGELNDTVSVLIEEIKLLNILIPQVGIEHITMAFIIARFCPSAMTFSLLIYYSTFIHKPVVAQGYKV